MPNPTLQDLRTRLRRLLPRLVLPALILASVWAVGYLLEVSVASVLARIVVWIVGTVIAVWLLWRLYQRLLWRVSGRLAFSYFLIGALPIPLAAILVLLVAYLVSGFFLGHLYRDALHDLKTEIEAVAAHAAVRDLGELAALEGGTLEAPGTGAEVAFGAYRAGRRVAGDLRAPETWPDWLTEPAADGSHAYAVLPDGTMTLAAAAESASRESTRGLVAFYTADLGELLRERSGLWVSLLRSTEGTESTRINIGSAGFHLGTEPLSPEEQSEVQEQKERFFREHAGLEGENRVASDQALDEGEPALGIDDLRDRPLLNWVEIEEPAHDLASGRSMGGELAVLLTASPRIVGRNLLSPSAEVGEFFWVALASVSLLLLTIYAVAELVALAMIIGLSRAVTRLYRATSRVAEGDFSVRIPVRRRDQVGALQRSFNSMAESLEDLVATSAQKELLEKELQIARQVQQSLIPKDLPRGDAVDFSTLFEPSAAIGGDYFDVLRLSDEALAVVIADVSGHGLPTGLRMAMVKAALGILVTEIEDPDEILRRLDSTVRSRDDAGDDSRFFVTATFARVDFRRGRVDLTNAGHPPTYLLRDGEVEEILLPSSPLGGLGNRYAGRRIELEDGDVLVWLSDGMIEATDGEGEPFGYERIQATLAGDAPTAAAVRERLVAAVDLHTGGRPAQDDRTLVVMRYRESGAPAEAVDDG